MSVGGDRGQNGTATLDDARRRLLEQLVAANYVWRDGDPADELVSTARELEADPIVVGRHRPFESTKTEIGSVSANVVRRAPCDVLVVR